MSEQVLEEFEECKHSFEEHCAIWGYETELDEDGFYVNSLTQRLFNAHHYAWQASRESVVVELPDWFVFGIDAAVYRDDIIEALNKAGVSYK